MTSRTTHRHAVEKAAVLAHLQLAAWTQLPVCYVFDNLDVLTPHDVLMTGRTGPRTTAGPGSAYYLIPTTRSLSFDEVFGASLHPPVAARGRRGWRGVQRVSGCGGRCRCFFWGGVPSRGESSRRAFTQLNFRRQPATGASGRGRTVARLAGRGLL